MSFGLNCPIALIGASVHWAIGPQNLNKFMIIHENIIRFGQSEFNYPQSFGQLGPVFIVTGSGRSILGIHNIGQKL